MWLIIESTEKLLKATEMDLWRRTAEKPRLEKIRNEAIRNILEENQDVMQYIRIN